MVDLILEVQQGGHDQLRGTEPESLRDLVQGLLYGSPALDIMLKQKQAGPEQVVHQKNLRRELPP